MGTDAKQDHQGHYVTVRSLRGRQGDVGNHDAVRFISAVPKRARIAMLERDFDSVYSSQVHAPFMTTRTASRRMVSSKEMEITGN